MRERTWTLIDAGRELDPPDFSIPEAGQPRPLGQFAIEKRRLRGGLREGVDLIDVDNGAARFDLVPTRGMGIWRAEVAGIPIGWQSPVSGPVHPGFVPVAEPSGLGWLDGFDELLVRCGLESNGAPQFDAAGRLVYPLHGRIANRPAHRVEACIDDGAGRLSVRGVVDETRFLFASLRLTSTFTTHLREPGFSVHDRIENRGGTPRDVQILYHVNFGPPLLEEGSRLIAAARTVAPRDAVAAEAQRPWDQYAGPVAGFAEEVFFLELAGDAQRRTRVLLRNAAGTCGVSLVFCLDQLPCFTLWKNTAAEADGYVTGLEPGTNFPNPRYFEAEQQRTVPLKPGQAIEIDLQMIVHTTAEQVAEAEAKIRQICGDDPPSLLKGPRPGWSAG